MEQHISPAKRKRLLKTYGSCPAGYTNEDLEHFLDLLYGIATVAFGAKLLLALPVIAILARCSLA